MDLDDARLKLFCHVFTCPAEMARSVAAAAHCRMFRAGAMVVRTGGRQDQIILILMGRARVLIYAVDGRSVRLPDLVPGDLFGSIEDGGVSDDQTEVVAETALETATYRAVDFLRLAQQHGNVGLALSRMLLRRLRWATERMVERSTISAAGRTYAEVLRMARAGGDGRTIRPAPVIAALAERAQTTRETASRAIAALERRGIVRRTADAMLIVAPQRLQDMIV